MIDNYKEMKEHLDFSDSDKFYFIQILKRKKDNPDMKKDVKIVRQFDISTEEDYDNFYSYILEKCKEVNARAYINVNRKSYKKVAHKMINFISDSLYEGKPEDARIAFNKVAGASKDKGSANVETNDKIWVVDIDVDDIYLRGQVLQTIHDLHKNINEKKETNFSIITINPTKNGYHILTNPFDIKQFHQQNIMNGFNKDQVDLKKEGTTLLIAP